MRSQHTCLFARDPLGSGLSQVHHSKFSEARGRRSLITLHGGVLVHPIEETRRDFHDTS